MEKADFIKKQWEEAKGKNPIVTCGCGARKPLRFMYKCYYCNEFYCEDCAPIHFGMTKEEYQKKKMIEKHKEIM
jgi:hypothetical protein